MGDDVSYKYGFGSSFYWEFLMLLFQTSTNWGTGSLRQVHGFPLLGLGRFFCLNQVMREDPPPIEARASMSGDVNVQSCFTFLALLLLENINADLANSALSFFCKKGSSLPHSTSSN